MISFFFVSEITSKIKVCSVNELPAGTSKCISANDKEIAVFNIDGKFYAIDNLCIHAGASLNESPIDKEKKQVVCHWHGWTYDLATGKCVSHPKQDVFTKTYSVSVENNEIFALV